jgi:hypothetical protein
MGATGAGADSLFTVAPCRVFDTRSTLTPLTGNQLFTLTEGTCGVPIWATAVAANVTLVNPTANVSLGVGPGDLAPTGTNVVSVAAGAVRAGFAVLPLATDQSGTVLAFPTFAAPGAQTDLLIDVSGYFAPANAGAPVKGQAQMYSQGGELDPGGATDPRHDVRPNTLGQPQLPATSTPGPTSPTSPTAITPIGIDRTTHRYFVDHGTITPLIGVSSDAACHLHLATNGNICTFDSSQSSWYKNVLNDAHNKGLNKIRLWVAINGGNCGLLPAYHDQPFRYFPTPAGPDGIGYWHLDQKNLGFFNSLKAVVDFAAQFTTPRMYVEVTFFAPWVGVWELGPWHPNHATLSTSPQTPIGFTDRSYFVKLDPSSGGSNANEAMRAYQMQVMHWTVDTLWSYDNIYWEIANEPEAYVAPSTGCGAPTPQTALGADVAQWQTMMINDLGAYEQANYVNTGLLARTHLIAVQPFSTDGADIYFANGGIGVINGHYTTVRQGPTTVGAIDLARIYANRPKILGFNEGKDQRPESRRQHQQRGHRERRPGGLRAGRSLGVHAGSGRNLRPLRVLLLVFQWPAGSPAAGQLEELPVVACPAADDDLSRPAFLGQPRAVAVQPPQSGQQHQVLGGDGADRHGDHHPVRFVHPPQPTTVQGWRPNEGAAGLWRLPADLWRLPRVPAGVFGTAAGHVRGAVDHPFHEHTHRRVTDDPVARQHDLRQRRPRVHSDQLASAELHISL